MNIKYLIAYFLVCICVFNPLHAKDNVDVVTTISVGVMSIDYDFTETVTSAIPVNSYFLEGDFLKHQYSPETQYAEIGVTVINDRLYYGLITLFSGQAVAEYNISDSTGLYGESLFESSSLSSYDAFVGYSVIDNANLYGGVTSSQSNIGNRVSFDNDIGIFAGASYILQYGASTSFTFDVSYMNSSSLVKVVDTFQTSVHEYDADVSGYSASVTWLNSLDRGRSFFVRLKYRDLSYDGTSSFTFTPETTLGPSAIDISTNLDGDQTITSLSIGMGF